MAGEIDPWIRNNCLHTARSPIGGDLRNNGTALAKVFEESRSLPEKHECRPPLTDGAQSKLTSCHTDISRVLIGHLSLHVR